MTETDSRFLSGVGLFNARDYEEAGEVFEELYFEGTRDEVLLARALLQVSVGLLHLERGQKRPAGERLEEGLLALGLVRDDEGFDLLQLREDVSRILAAFRRGGSVDWPHIVRFLPGSLNPKKD